jgi:hypothetical protein
MAQEQKKLPRLWSRSSKIAPIIDISTRLVALQLGQGWREPTPHHGCVHPWLI